MQGQIRKQQIFFRKNSEENSINGLNFMCPLRANPAARSPSGSATADLTSSALGSVPRPQARTDGVSTEAPLLPSAPDTRQGVDPPRHTHTPPCGDNPTDRFGATPLVYARCASHQSRAGADPQVYAEARGLAQQLECPDLLCRPPSCHAFGLAIEDLAPATSSESAPGSLGTPIADQSS